MDADSEILRVLADMGSQDPQARLEAVRFLGDHGDEHAVQPLCESLLKDSSRHVQESAATSLGRMALRAVEEKFEFATWGAVDALLQAIDSDRYDEQEGGVCVLAEAAEALGHVCCEWTSSKPFHSRVVPALSAVMLDNWNMRPQGWPNTDGFEYGRCNTAAARALGWVGDKGAIDSLFRAFEAHFIHFEFDTDEWEEACRFDVDPPYGDFINQTSFWAMWSIGEIGHSDALPRLESLTRQYSDRWKRGQWEEWELPLWAQVAEAIGKIGESSSSTALWDFYNALMTEHFNNMDPHPKDVIATGVRESIVKALVEVDAPDLVILLLDVFEHDNWRLRKIAAEPLGEIGDPAALGLLHDFLDDMSRFGLTQGPFVPCEAEVCNVVIEALGQIGASDSIDFLVRALWLERRHIRFGQNEILAESAVYALAAIGEHDDRAIEELERYLRESRYPKRLDIGAGLIRVLIIENLMEMEREDSVTELINRLDDDVLEVRAAAASAARHFCAKEAVEPLLKLLNGESDPKAPMQCHACGFASNPDEDWPWISGVPEKSCPKCGEDGRPWIGDRIQSALALGKIAERDTAGALVNALNDPDEQVRWSAAYGLGDLAERCQGWAVEVRDPLCAAAGDDESEHVREAARIAVQKWFSRMFFNMGLLPIEIADGIVDDFMLDKRLLEGRRWLIDHR